MFFIFSILLLSITFVELPSSFERVIERIDYYESLSNPVICIELLHQYPTGPFYLYSTFTYTLYPKISDNETEFKFNKYIFLRVDRVCETSINFTLGVDFKELEIGIKFYISRKISCFACFIYKFYYGFKPGFYTLRDINNNFKTIVKVSNEPQEYLEIPAIFEYSFGSNQKFIKTKNYRLCVITENNNAVILNPNYRSYVPNGLIFGIMAEIFRDKKIIGERIYNAYVCFKDKEYFHKPTVFITDDKSYSIKFNVLYWKWATHTKEFKMKFELSQPKFIDVHNMQYVSQKYNKVFLIRYKGDFKYCPDESQIFIYRSEDNTTYFVHAKKNKEILHHVEFIEKIDRSVDDPCSELNK